MTQQAELQRKIDNLPPQFFGEVIDFIGYLQTKTQQTVTQTENPAKEPPRRELAPEEEARIKVFPNKNMTAEEEKKWINDNAEWLNKEAEDVLKYQVDIFSPGDSDL